MDGKQEMNQGMGTAEIELGKQVVLEAAIGVIKTKMPNTYIRIQERGADPKTNTYTLVRRGILGEKNCFWACENGYVVGAIFDIEDVARHIAMFMVQFTGQHVCIFPSFLEG